MPDFSDYIQRFKAGPYGTNEGDIWSAEDTPVGKMLKERQGFVMIWECFRNDDGVEQRTYNVAENNPDPEMQDLIRRAREGTERYQAAQAQAN